MALTLLSVPEWIYPIAGVHTAYRSVDLGIDDIVPAFEWIGHLNCVPS